MRGRSSSWNWRWARLDRGSPDKGPMRWRSASVSTSLPSSVSTSLLLLLKFSMAPLPLDAWREGSLWRDSAQASLLRHRVDWRIGLGVQVEDSRDSNLCRRRVLFLQNNWNVNAWRAPSPVWSSESLLTPTISTYKQLLTLNKQSIELICEGTTAWRFIITHAYHQRIGWILRYYLVFHQPC